MHIPFTLTPLPITRHRFQSLQSKAGVLGKLIHKASQDDAFLKQAMEPITEGDPFFKHLWESHLKLQTQDTERRLPLLIMRSDFMDDATVGPKLIEFNAIAAGMGPFGQRIHELHKYVYTQHPTTYHQFSALPHTDTDTDTKLELVQNKAIDSLAEGIAQTTLQIKNEFNDDGPPRFLMVVQPDEDNVYDQHLLEYALQERGIQTVRRSFRELHDTLSSGESGRLMLEGVGSIDTVYLRSGYSHCDFYLGDLDQKDQCCHSLLQTRIFMEKHRVAMNATIRQQMASSKRVQTLLSAMNAQELCNKFELTHEEARAVKELLGTNLPITGDTIHWLEKENVDNWVLKNQGEGGGHAIFGQDIIHKLQELSPDDYAAWSIMQRLRPTPRSVPTVLVRKGEPQLCPDLISEIGVFTVHADGVPATNLVDEHEHEHEDNNDNTHNAGGYAGYLIRSKPALAPEGGVHSGMGVLDSLVYASN
ncbi:Glutathione synthetase, chloroplastic [Seminavis robusta]|uniref:Glutathione synthetase n=1 Tax=Seminavis robusta TaxID=568900 RepID=A0A9N8E8J5_9STRA|nr:Glutathione synthetase, chloroplastic [Seminavis robusta]|eukprot:Sro739_g195420.1 Glutathione synthetase, chloroplastic (476) ;mRNA; f:31017-32444